MITAPVLDHIGLAKEGSDGMFYMCNAKRYETVNLFELLNVNYTQDVKTLKMSNHDHQCHHLHIQYFRCVSM